jgi:hypothetical protein
MDIKICRLHTLHRRRRRTNMTKPDENNLPREGLETARFPTVKVVGSNPVGPTKNQALSTKISLK